MGLIYVFKKPLQLLGETWAVGSERAERNVPRWMLMSVHKRLRRSRMFAW